MIALNRHHRANNAKYNGPSENIAHYCKNGALYDGIWLQNVFKSAIPHEGRNQPHNTSNRLNGSQLELSPSYYNPIYNWLKMNTAAYPHTRLVDCDMLGAPHTQTQTDFNLFNDKSDYTYHCLIRYLWSAITHGWHDTDTSSKLSHVDPYRLCQGFIKIQSFQSPFDQQLYHLWLKIGQARIEQGGELFQGSNPSVGSRKKQGNNIHLT